ncbi:hypothetical protein IGJ93_001910 [Enterococcus sp. DIV0174]
MAHNRPVVGSSPTGYIKALNQSILAEGLFYFSPTSYSPLR